MGGLIYAKKLENAPCLLFMIEWASPPLTFFYRDMILCWAINSIVF